MERCTPGPTKKSPKVTVHLKFTKKFQSIHGTFLVFFQIGSFLFVFWGLDGSIGTVFSRKMATRPKKADEKGKVVHLDSMDFFLFVF